MDPLCTLKVKNPELSALWWIKKKRKNSSLDIFLIPFWHLRLLCLCMVVMGSTKREEKDLMVQQVEESAENEKKIFFFSIDKIY